MPNRLHLVFNLLLGLLALGLFFVWHPVGQAPAASFPVQVDVLDVGQGDSILIESPNANVLVDAGPHGNDIVGDLQPELGREVINYLVLTHPDADHIGGAVDVLSHYKVDTVLMTGAEADTKTFTDLKSYLADHQIAVKYVTAQDDFALDGLQFDILYPLTSLVGQHPAQTNNTSIVMHMSYQDFDILLTGDAGVPVENQIAGELSPYEVLKVGHHGSSSSTGAALLAAVRPQVAVISDGLGNSYGHPHQITLDHLASQNVQVFRTDLNGKIKILTDGKFFYVRSEKISKSG
jgi:competence protein ComEC